MKRTNRHHALVLSIARNIALDRLRHLKVVPIVLMAEIDELERYDLSQLLDNITNSEQELRIVIDAIRQLPPETAKVMVLKKVYGYSQKEIAARLKKSENTVEQQLFLGSRKFAELLGSALPNFHDSHVDNYSVKTGTVPSSEDG